MKGPNGTVCPPDSPDAPTGFGARAAGRNTAFEGGGYDAAPMGRPAGPATAMAMERRPAGAGPSAFRIPDATADDFMRLEAKREHDERQADARSAFMGAARQAYPGIDWSKVKEAIADSPDATRLFAAMAEAGAKRQADEKKQGTKKEADERAWGYYRKKGESLLREFEGEEGGTSKAFRFAVGGKKVPTAQLKEQVQVMQRSLGEQAKAQDAQELAEFKQGKINARELARRTERRMAAAQSRSSRATEALNTIRRSAVAKGYDPNDVGAESPYSSMILDATEELEQAHVDLSMVVQRWRAIQESMQGEGASPAPVGAPRAAPRSGGMIDDNLWR